MRRPLMTAVAIGLTLGFGVTYALLPDRETSPRAAFYAPVHIDLSFAAREAKADSLLEGGWEKPEAWGVWSRGGQSVVLVHLRSPVREDVVLFIEARSRLNQAKNARVSLEVNGSPIGIWELTGKDREAASFMVGNQIANREHPIRIAFRSEVSAVGLRSITLRSKSSLTRFGGYVDTCQQNRISGWAKTDLLLSPLIVQRDGGSVSPIVLRNVIRPDLAPHGHPAGSGFEIELPQATNPAAKLDVTFPNGRPLGNSPCLPDATR